MNVQNKERIAKELRAKMTMWDKLYDFVEGDAFTAAIGFVVLIVDTLE